MDFLCAVAADIGAEHNVVLGVSVKVLLIEVRGIELGIATSTVNVLLVLHRELQNQGLSLVADGFIELGRDGVESSIFAGLNSLVLLSITVKLAG